MDLLKEIARREPVDRNGRTIAREAVRGIALDATAVLMAYAAQVGAYKFPGGGIHAGESHAEALRREVAEECGAGLSEILRPFGKVIEYDIPVEPEYGVFRMTSYYYLCRVDPGLSEQHLDDYERELGLTPRWVDVRVALAANRALLDSERPRPKWLVRDSFVLELIKEAALISHTA